ncbi:MAG: amino acid permease, partial [Phycisphaeraceae bacterium]|nr:amino acid permease [Phycisphaeraceae bacterium]
SVRLWRRRSVPLRGAAQTPRRRGLLDRLWDAARDAALPPGSPFARAVPRCRHLSGGTAYYLNVSLGLPAALAIGVGTMVGAGIFIFPGIAAGRAGPAAMISFALAGAIALLVALCTAELATAMPESGGGYHFVSRGLGPFWGALVGMGQWLGLIFASAFYLVGFGEYVVALMQDLGWSPGDPVVLVALGTALTLTVINLLGTRGAGRLQNSVVAGLTMILSLLFGYGVLKATGLLGPASWPTPFAPQGAWPVLTTTALIFTSYLGFVQIATVAGEIRRPQRNLPRALVGSVLIVTVLYVLALFVSTSLVEPDRLAELGETAMVTVARTLAGEIGAMAILAAGLLATLSSANASILSSSRAIYALSRDGMVPEGVSRVNDRFGTPHVALLAVGVPIAGLTMMGQVEVLAEVASLFHLLMYGLICVTLLVLRRRRPLWFAPTFRVWGATGVAGAGALTSFGLVGLMQPLSLIIGGGVLVGVGAWFWIWRRGISLPPPQPPHIAPAVRQPRIVVPVDVEDPTSLPAKLLDALGDLELFILGYQLVKEQTSPEQAREESGDRAEEALESIKEEMADRRIDVDSHLIYTADFADMLAEYVHDKNCQAVLMPKPMDRVDRLVVPIYAHDQISVRLLTLLRDLSESANLPVTGCALGQTEDSENPGAGESAIGLRQEMVRRLERTGLGRDRIRWSTAESDDLVEAITDMEQENDLVILGESASSERPALFTRLHEEIREKLSCPTLVVLRESVSAEDDEEDDETAEAS